MKTISLFAIILAFYGCNSSNTPDDGDAGAGAENGGSSGSGGKAGGKGGSSGSTASGGSDSFGGADSIGGAAGEPSDAGGEAGEESNAAGNGGEAGDSQGSVGGEAGAQASSGGTAGTNAGRGGSGNSGTGGGGTSGGSSGGTGGSDGGIMVRQIEGGYAFTCALTSAGGVKCWGESSYGTLGTTLSGRSATAVDVQGLTSGVKSIAVGDWHACAIKDDDRVVCWGFNEYDQLAIDTALTGSAAPVSLTGFNGFAKDVGVGTNRTSCLVDDIGGILCWGSNSYAQFGVSTPPISGVPVAVTSIAFGYKAVTTGISHTCGLTETNGVKCWGSYSHGQLGSGTNPEINPTIVSADPVDVLGLTSGVKEVNNGNHFSCALLESGGVKCWGANDYGFLGTGGTAASDRPVDVSGLIAGISDISTSERHSCALVAAGGTVMCWGYNQNGQLGNNPADISINEFSPTPVAVVGLSGAISVAAGKTHSCAAMATGGVKCWGSGWASGSTLSTNQLTPLTVGGF